MSPQPEDTVATMSSLHEVDGQITCHVQPLLEDIAADEDEDSMQGLIRHMVCMILQPFAEHVRQLQTQMLHAQKDMHLLDDRCSQNKAHLEDHDRDFLSLRSTFGQLSARLDKTQLEIAKEHEEAVKLEHDLETTKVALSKTNDRHQSTRQYMDAIQQRFDEFIVGMDNAKIAHAKLDKSFRGHLKSFQLLKESHDELIGRNTEGGHNSIDQYGEQIASLEREFQRFLKNQKKQTEEDTQILGSLNAHVTSLHATMEDTRESLHKTTADLRSTNGDVQLLKDSLDYVHGQLKVVDEMQRSHQEMHHTLRKSTDLLSKTDTALEKLGDAFVVEKHSSGAALQDLRAKVETHADTLMQMNKTQGRQGDLLKDTVWRTDKLQRESKRLQEQGDNGEMEMQNMAASLRTAHSKLDKHDQEHSKTSNELQSLSKAFDDGLSQMRGELGNASTNLTKLNSRFEASNSNLQGIGKGLQDVHRHIQAGENGMLSPKTARSVNTNMLPALSARTSQAMHVSPRQVPPSSWAMEMFTSGRPSTETHQRPRPPMDLPTHPGRPHPRTVDESDV